MNIGHFIAIIGLGLIWTVVGSVQARVARDQDCDLGNFYAFGCGLVLVICLIPVCLDDVGIGGQFSAIQYEAWILLLVGGVCNALGQQAVLVAMGRGSRGITWAIAQSAMVAPFLMGILWWHESAGLWALTGIIAMIVGLIILALARGDRGEPLKSNSDNDNKGGECGKSVVSQAVGASPKQIHVSWLFWALAAFSGIALAQCFLLACLTLMAQGLALGCVLL